MIKTIRDLTHAIVDTYDVEDYNGNLVSPKIEVHIGRHKYLISDLSLNDEDKIIIKVKKL